MRASVRTGDIGWEALSQEATVALVSGFGPLLAEAQVHELCQALLFTARKAFIMVYRSFRKACLQAACAQNVAWHIHGSPAKMRM